MGIPLNITGGSSTGYTGEVRIHKRNLKVDGSLSGQYVLDAVVGAVGDTLNINQRTLTARTYRRDYTADALTANGSFTLRGLPCVSGITRVLQARARSSFMSAEALLNPRI